MAKLTVVKRSGKRQAFSPAKLKRAVEKACKEAKISAPKRRKIAAEVAKGLQEGLKGKRSVKAAELRRRTLGRLERRSKAAAKAWRRYEKKKKKR